MKKFRRAFAWLMIVMLLQENILAAVADSVPDLPIVVINDTEQVISDEVQIELKDPVEAGSGSDAPEPAPISDL